LLQLRVGGDVSDWSTEMLCIHVSIFWKSLAPVLLLMCFQVQNSVSGHRARCRTRASGSQTPRHAGQEHCRARCLPLPPSTSSTPPNPTLLWLIEFDCGLSNSIVVDRIRLWLIELDCGFQIRLWFIEFDRGLSNSIVVYRIRLICDNKATRSQN
jgi:hypothetical protein